MTRKLPDPDCPFCCTPIKPGHEEICIGYKKAMSGFPWSFILSILTIIISLAAIGISAYTWIKYS